MPNNSGKPQFLINKLESKNSWIGFKVVNDKNKRVDVGAVLSLEASAGKSISKWVKTDGSYSSAHDNRVHFGLGANVDTVNLKIKWVDGKETTYKNLKTNKYYTLNK